MERNSEESVAFIKMKSKFFFGLLVCFCFVAAAKQANVTVYQVGPQRTFSTLGAVVEKLGPGDIVEIDAGTYREAVKIQCNGNAQAPIILRGVGVTRPIFDAQGLVLSGRGATPRAALQIEGAHIRVEHLEFKNARNGENAAGIRLLDSMNAFIGDCVVTECDMGIFGGDRETATIVGCEVAFNGAPKFDGYSHNFYMSGNRVVVRDCSIHDSRHGQNFKSRAHFNELWFNTIADSNEGEVGFVDAPGATDRPHSNALLFGNTLVSRADRGGNQNKFLLFGSESGAAHQGTLYLFCNSFIARDARNQFVKLDAIDVRAVMRNNVFLGSQNIFAAPQALPQSAPLVASNNLVPRGALLAQITAPTTDDATFQYTDGDGFARQIAIVKSK